LAKILDGNFHGLFLADMLGIFDVYEGPGNLEEALPGGAQVRQSPGIQMEGSKSRGDRVLILE
jgi:hypothetical protein